MPNYNELAVMRRQVRGYRCWEERTDTKGVFNNCAGNHDLSRDRFVAVNGVLC